MRAVIPWALVALLTGALRAQPPEGAALAARYQEVADGLLAAQSAYDLPEEERAAPFASALTQADAAFQQAAEIEEVSGALRLHIPVWEPLGRSPRVTAALGEAARKFAAAARAAGEVSDLRARGLQLRAAGDTAGADAADEEAKGKQAAARELAFRAGWKSADAAAAEDARITDAWEVLAVLLVVLGALFWINAHPRYGRFFKVVPLLLFCYFVPTALSNFGWIPISSPLYDAITRYLLPCSLFLLVLAVDIPAIMKLGRNAVVLFLVATATVVIGGPVAFLICRGILPDDPEVWKGLAALSGSWIGGGANFVAIGTSVGASSSTISMMVVVDVAVAECWMFFLLMFAGREKAMDEKIGADRSSIDAVRERIETFEREVSRPTTLTDLLVILALAMVTTVVSLALVDRGYLPPIRDPEGSVIIGGFVWVVILVTTVATILSFTRVRRLEGAGASKIGSLFLYLLIASIGAHAQFSKVAQVPTLFVAGAVWMAFHAIVLLLVRRWLRAPIFFLAVGSRANIGGAASAPVLASAFHPSLAPVGVLLAVGGYVLGTYGGLACAGLLRWLAS